MVVEFKIEYEDAISVVTNGETTETLDLEESCHVLNKQNAEIRIAHKIIAEVYTNDFLQSVEEMVEEIYELTGNRYPDFLNKLNLIQSNEPK
ncbi:MAG: hypothetical protein ACTSRU_14385 [Candidatus Hodarchaeales archaeon]